ncbi:MAG: RagB/SusD family nutrient uptake outer membrane protein [Prevotella sp.]|nr:RagB/SusD family nutrient uptake outer membrane protein [Prevotella sp.]
MKKINLFYTIAFGAFALTSCDDYLDKMPDNRATIDTEEKVTKILVSAYATHNSNLMLEMASDNARDNGSTYTIGAQTQEEAYLWKPITETDNDSSKDLWDACYGAAAAANQALQAIDEMGNPASLQAQRGEALLCRAWAHFQLANVFCLAYNPETADKDMGIPYALAPETEVSPHYERGTMNELYAHINADIEEGLPLIDDKIYTVPKYHFNKKAAYAFAARFNLYYQKWDKTIEYANAALGSNPLNLLRNWRHIVNELASDYLTRCNAYISASENSNFLLQTAYSSSGYFLGAWNLGNRYGHEQTNIARTETYRAPGIWGAYNSARDLFMAHSCWGPVQHLNISKYYGYFEYTDKVNGIGYRQTDYVQFCADETLLCRAEAYAVKGDLVSALRDMNIWLSTNSRNGMQATQELVNQSYGTYNEETGTGMKYMDDAEGKPLAATEKTEGAKYYGTPKKHLHPLGFTIGAEGSDQENMIQFILHMRRCQMIQEGGRWCDIKRWGIEIAHNREGMPNDYLLKDDPRRAFQLPNDVLDAGLPGNPRN